MNIDTPNDLEREPREDEAQNKEAPLILAVDDEPEILEIIHITLRTEGYNVALARNGREALQQVAAVGPALVIMDVTMPEMDGFEALRRLKEDPKTENLPVVMLTALAEEADILAGWLRGADLYLTKPFDPFELLAHVNRVLRDSQVEDDEFFSSL